MHVGHRQQRGELRQQQRRLHKVLERVGDVAALVGLQAELAQLERPRQVVSARAAVFLLALLPLERHGRHLEQLLHAQARRVLLL